MYIDIEKNTKGNLQIEKKVINRLVENVILSTTKISNPQDVSSSIYLLEENQLHILITIRIQDQKLQDLNINEDKIFKAIDKIINQTISIKPKNINISYIK
ncbi:hypothetical protein FOY66_02730 [Mycoplasma capricolum subsp. capripneumoniae]|uniref:Uncharacterized protein n=1 Tax=Mycoplasma capricolum subsp. capripneumoniae 87001 TaxID=1124992 RepID=A0A9N7ASS8_MYCCC|nr:hypothetical protein [Mycoplasma capricolum]AJK51558.1 hypothetical protein MCCG_0605 [Mycoplasma capricolum subsp. capripneumoniae 87001]AOQ22214.1 hypothetical protein M1601_02745 [Mycoplasma capricolum subsp. capripneumoniae M1601]KEY84620.1 hypothetical protein MCCP_3270 [Mycoplasma capricolum subsp. capripneumoniae 99108]QDL19680.1 hypothetical protein DQW15_02745 [Mycoplasma capricolum subsp. capripneumoniae]QDL20365.1 hypothetical protein DQW16_02745 [Mycoplasma capricolum subsp. cap